jgi:hypothetical protein
MTDGGGIGFKKSIQAAKLDDNSPRLILAGADLQPALRQMYEWVNETYEARDLYTGKLKSAKREVKRYLCQMSSTACAGPSIQGIKVQFCDYPEMDGKCWLIVDKAELIKQSEQ